MSICACLCACACGWVCLCGKQESHQTQELSCDTHVCELQLQLRTMAELQNEQTHERYLKFRKETSRKAISVYLRRLLPSFFQSKSSAQVRVGLAARCHACPVQHAMRARCRMHTHTDARGL